MRRPAPDRTLVGLIGLCLVALFAQSYRVSAAEIETTVRHKTETDYVCVDISPDIVRGGNDRRTTSRNDCKARSAAKPGSTFELRWTEVIRSAVMEDNREWVVAPYWRSNDRPLYACDSACQTQQKRGASLGRSHPEGIGRCEGELNPAWGNSTKQWQFHTNADGVRGITYCAFIDPLGPAPETGTAFAALPLTSSAGCDIVVTWTMPTTLADGSPFPEGYTVTPRVYLGSDYMVEADLESGACLVGVPAGDTHEIRMTSYGSDGQESALSNSVTVVR